MGAAAEAMEPGDPARALTLAFRDNRQAMYGLARRICGEDAAADVVQEVFLRVWRTTSFDPRRASMKNYLMVVTRGVAIDVLRHRTAAVRRDNWHGRREPSISNELEQLLLVKETNARVAAAVTRLSPSEQAVIRAAFYNGLTHREIAVRFGLADGTVKSRIRLALVKLRIQLGDTVGLESTG